MHTIHKYRLGVMDRWQELKMPTDARVVHVAEQPPGSGETLSVLFDGEPHATVTLWVQVNDDRDLEVRRFLIVGTGQPLTRSPKGKMPAHVGTVVTASGQLVWHVYAEPSLT